MKKTPDERLDYTLDWSSWLDTGDTVVAAAFAIETIEDPPTLEIAAETNDSTTSNVLLDGGLLGMNYVVRCHITTLAGRHAERCFHLRIVDHRFVDEEVL